jgi:hypothetical protein
MAVADPIPAPSAPPGSATPPDPAWLETLKRVGPIAFPLLVGAMIGRRAPRTFLREVAPAMARELDASRLPVTFRVAHEPNALGTTGVNNALTPKELAQFAQHPSAALFREGDPAVTINLREFPSGLSRDELRARIPELVQNITPARAGLGAVATHEGFHATDIVRKAAKTEGPLSIQHTRDAMLKAHKLADPDLPHALQLAVTAWPDLWGQYYVSRIGGGGPATSVMEILNEYKNRALLRSLPQMRDASPSALMTYATRDVVEATRPHGVELMAELEAILRGRTKPTPQLRYGEASPFPKTGHLPVGNAQLYEQVQAARSGRPWRPPVHDFSKYELRVPEAYATDPKRTWIPRTFSHFRDNLRLMAQQGATKDQYRNVLLNAESHGIDIDRLRPYINPRDYPFS